MSLQRKRLESLRFRSSPSIVDSSWQRTCLANPQLPCQLPIIWLTFVKHCSSLIFTLLFYVTETVCATEWSAQLLARLKPNYSFFKLPRLVALTLLDLIPRFFFFFLQTELQRPHIKSVIWIILVVRNSWHESTNSSEALFHLHFIAGPLLFAIYRTEYICVNSSLTHSVEAAGLSPSCWMNGFYSKNYYLSAHRGLKMASSEECRWVILFKVPELWMCSSWI